MSNLHSIVKLSSFAYIYGTVFKNKDYAVSAESSCRGRKRLVKARQLRGLTLGDIINERINEAL